MQKTMKRIYIKPNTIVLTVEIESPLLVLSGVTVKDFNDADTDINIDIDNENGDDDGIVTAKPTIPGVWDNDEW